MSVATTWDRNRILFDLILDISLLFQGIIIWRETKSPMIRKRLIIFEELIKEKLENLG
ncbi:11034_t:CDS:2 [Funneliformis geosporum]|uniref:11034_t:CDS:1 n=1 Tax=Funneliformis geosporum TaxID=1117311 RepID=A0A9W4SSX7_9GLOM|nr:11034_t:CDS:2 [Funneliformis geosporum]